MSNPFTDDQAYAPGPSSALLSAEQIRAREMDLDRRQQKVEYKGYKLGEIREEATKGKQPPNWPKCKPIIYHDIQHDIPEQGRPMVKRVYFSWMMSIVALFLNMIALLAGVIVDPNQGVSFGISIALFLLGLVVPFIFWYRPFYNAIRNDRGISFFAFFFSYAWHIVLIVVYAIGIPSSGGGGFIVAIQVMNISTGAGAILLISAGFWSLLGVFCVLQFLMAYRYYRGRGHSVKGDATNIAKEAAESEAGRAAIAQGGKAVVAGAAQQYSS